MSRRRRGIGEIVGAFIVITIITLTAILLAYAISHAGSRSAELIESKIREFEEESQKLIILPYVDGGNLKLFISPLVKNEKIRIYLVNGSTVNYVERVVNGTYFNDTVLQEYNCNNIEIIVERESGALFIYNALNDPRANRTIIAKLGDPRIFNCRILKKNYTSISDPLTKQILTPLKIPYISYNTTRFMGLTVTAVLKGSIAYTPSGNKICDVRLSSGNHTIQVKGSCQARLRAYTSRNYNITIVLNETGKEAILYAVIKGRKPGTIFSGTANMFAKLDYMGGGRVDPGVKTSGTLYNTVLPLVLAQYSNSTIKYKTTIIYDANTYLAASGTAKGDYHTNGPILLAVITNKIRDATIYIKIQLNVTHETDFYGTTTTIQASKGSIIDVEATSYWSIVPEDLIAKAINAIPPKDWGTANPQLEVKYGRIIKTYNIYNNIHYIIYNNKQVYANIVWNAGFNLPWLTGLTLHTSVQAGSSNVTRTINGTTLITAIPVKQFIPIIIKINQKRYLASMDYPGRLNLKNIGTPSSLSPYIIYALDGYRLSAARIGAKIMCFASVNGANPLPSRLINQTAQCAGTITLKGQELGLLLLIKINNKNPRIGSFPITGAAYRITWTS